MFKRILRAVSLCLCVFTLLSSPVQALGFFGIPQEASEVVKAQKLILQPRSSDLLVGAYDTVTLTVASQPENADLTGITWKSSNPAAAVVSDNGTVRAVSGGSATITATDSLSRKRVTCAVKVYILPESITMNKEVLTVRAGRTAPLKAKILPSRYIRKQDKVITWATSDPSIATVTAKGKVTAVSPGIVTITAMTVNGLQSVCEVTITENG